MLPRAQNEVLTISSSKNPLLVKKARARHQSSRGQAYEMLCTGLFDRLNLRGVLVTCSLLTQRCGVEPLCSSYHHASVLRVRDTR